MTHDLHDLRIAENVPHGRVDRWARGVSREDREQDQQDKDHPQPAIKPAFIIWVLGDEARGIFFTIGAHTDLFSEARRKHKILSR